MVMMSGLRALVNFVVWISLCETLGKALLSVGSGSIYPFSAMWGNARLMGRLKAL